MATFLTKRGYKVWLDEFELKLGDSLSRSVDRGLAESRYGLVILSQAFFAKRWPKRELSGLVSREVISGEKVILPIWHKVTPQDVVRYSPPLADKMASDTASGIPKLASDIIAVLGRPTKPPLEDLAYHDLPVHYRRAIIAATMKIGAFEPDDLGKLGEADYILKHARMKEAEPELLELIEKAEEHVKEELQKVFEDMEQMNPPW